MLIVENSDIFEMRSHKSTCLSRLLELLKFMSIAIPVRKSQNVVEVWRALCVAFAKRAAAAANICKVSFTVDFLASERMSRQGRRECGVLVMFW